MKKQTTVSTTDKGKIITIHVLFAISIIITLSGAIFSIYSVINEVNFSVLNSSIPGVAFGAVAAFLGVRYFLSVRKLKVEVYKKSSKFSWGNFKRQNRVKYCQKADN